MKQLAPGAGARWAARCQPDTFPTCQGICGTGCGWLWHQHKINWSKQMRRGISVYPDGLWIDKRAETIRNSNPLCLCRRQSQWLQWCQNVLKASLRTVMPIKTRKKEIKSSNSNSLKTEGLPAGQTHGALPWSQTPQKSFENIYILKLVFCLESVLLAACLRCAVLLKSHCFWLFCSQWWRSKPGLEFQGEAA